MGLAQATNTIVFISAWIFYLPDRLASADSYKNVFELLRTLWNIPVHALPLIFSSLNLFLFTNTVVHMLDVWSEILMITLYGAIAFLYTISTDTKIYPFLSFNLRDGESTAFVVATPVALFWAFILTGLFTQYIRGRWEWEQPWWKSHIGS